MNRRKKDTNTREFFQPETGPLPPIPLYLNLSGFIVSFLFVLSLPLFKGGNGTYTLFWSLGNSTI